MAPGLPLERYTSDWTKKLAQKDEDHMQSCHSSRSKKDHGYYEYLGVTTMYGNIETSIFPKSDYDFQCIFNTFA